MLANIATPLGFVALLLLFTVGAIGALLLHRHDHRANVWGSLFAIAGSVWGVLFAIAVLVGGNDIAAAVQLSPFPLFTFSVHIDKLSAFFLAVISLIALFSSTYGIGYVKHYYKQYSIGALGFFYNLFIAGMLLVVSASNGIFFLVAWELMSLASYFLVVYDRKDAQNVKAGFLYLVMTHV
ncbi:MAG: proton-conducting transporter membrane subunit, partial [Patescibacteria group bacterium]